MTMTADAYARHRRAIHDLAAETFGHDAQRTLDTLRSRAAYLALSTADRELARSLGRLHELLNTTAAAYADARQAALDISHALGDGGPPVPASAPRGPLVAPWPPSGGADA